MKTVLVFGSDNEGDHYALGALPALRKAFPAVSFEHVDPNESIEEYGPKLVILDAWEGEKVHVVTEKTAEELEEEPRFAHSSGVASLLLALVKAKLIRKFSLVCVPAHPDILELKRALILALQNG